ncbi:helix-turn-helix transcriptional regulator [Ornithinibacillus xuwenensis]|uniref:Helix-turn-helix transcriptional regulator n=1 Tax=Ornithinibacillus xuwenensis TaxID=3144668 RepID=A0ABU9XEF7_9BACI
MGIDVGQAIKINRLRLNMTQSDLAKGIISVSYLSKIENGTAEPPHEVLELLSERLQLNPLEPGIQIDHNTVIRWFHHLLRSNVDESIRIYNKLRHNLTNAIDKKLLSLIEIHKLHYYILINDKTEAENLVFSLQKSSKRFNEVEKYYYYKFLGNYHYSLLSFKKALEYYQTAEQYGKSEIFHQNEEINNLYYLIGNVASKVRQTHLCLLYTIRALEYYQSNYDLKKCAECHILQGISYRRINEIEKAKESYRYAINIAEKIEDKETLKLGYQNLGTLNSIGKDSIEAIDYFLKSYELRKNDRVDRRIVPVSSLMKEYYSLGDIKNSQVWLEIGLNLCKSLEPIDSVYVYEFDVYNFLITGYDNSFEKLIIKKIIPFFEARELYYEKSVYLELLANYYKQNRKYKLSTYYYEEAFKTISKIINI